VLRFRWLTRPGWALARRSAGLLDHRFGARGLALLRAVVLAHAVEAGMPESRARDVMLAAHELAANAIRHGAGTGQLQMRAGDGMLRVQVHDAGLASRTGEAGTAGPDG
jgi:anti-sigma regulatory factor (Ser/Thr protein kinase)